MKHNTVEKLSSSCKKPGHHYLGIVLLMAAIVMAYLYFFFHIPILQTGLFFLGIGIFLFFPGAALLDLLEWRDDPIQLFALSLLTGLAISPIVYYLLSLIGISHVFLIFIALTIFFLIYKNVYIKRLLFIPAHLVLPKGWWKAIGILFLLLSILHFSHFGDIQIIDGGGYKLRISEYTETIYHLGVINAAENTIPPIFPYASGYSLAEYHIDMHLVAVIFCKFLYIDPVLMTYYFLPFLLLGMILIAPAMLFYHLHKDVNLSLLLGVLMFSADFSFIPALWNGMDGSHPWTMFFCTTIWSLFTLNGVMAAVPLFFGAVMAFHNYFTSRNIRHLILFSLFAIAAYRVKSSMGLQVIGVAFLSLGFYEFKYHIRQWREVLPVLIITSVLIMIDILIKSYMSEGNWVVRWDIFNGFVRSAYYLGMSQWVEAALDPWHHPVSLLWGLSLYFLGFMGIRLLFLKSCYDVWKQDKPFEPIIPFLLLFIIGGIFVSEVIYLGGEYDSINNSVWFRVQSIIAATYFAVTPLLYIKNNFDRIIIVMLLLLLSFPTSIQFLVTRQNDKTYSTITLQELLAVDYIKKATPADAVILELPNVHKHSLASNFAGRSVVINYYKSFVEGKLSPQMITERKRDVLSFFYYNDENLRLRICVKYNIAYLIVPTEYKESFSQYSWASLVYSNPELSIVKINVST